MGLLAKLMLSGIKKKQFEAIAEVNPQDNKLFRQIAYFMGGKGQAISTQENKEGYIDRGYHYNDMVYSVIHYIASKAATVDFRAVATDPRTGKKEILDGHEILAPIYSPNDYQGKLEFMEQLFGFKLITGDSFTYQIRVESGPLAGKIAQQHVLPSHFTDINSGTQFEPISHYTLRYGDRSIEYDRDEILHIQYQNYKWDYGREFYGLSPLHAGFLLLEKANANNEAAKSSFDNLGALGLLYDKTEITSRGAQDVLSEPQADRMQYQLDKKVRGSKNKGRILIQSGDFGYHQFGVSPADLKLLEDKQASLRDICNLYHLPSEVMNDKASSTYNNMKEARKAAWTDAILPHVYSFAQEYSRTNKRAYKEGNRIISIEPDKSSIEELQADLQTMTQWLKDAHWLTDNQKLEIMGMEPYPGGDVRWKPSNLIPEDAEPLNDPNANE